MGLHFYLKGCFLIMTKDELTALIERIDSDETLFKTVWKEQQKAVDALGDLRDAMVRDTDRPILPSWSVSIRGENL